MMYGGTRWVGGCVGKAHTTAVLDERVPLNRAIHSLEVNHRTWQEPAALENHNALWQLLRDGAAS